MSNEKRDAAALECVAEMAADPVRFMAALARVRPPKTTEDLPDAPAVNELNAFVRGTRMDRDKYRRKIVMLQQLQGGIRARKTTLGDLMVQYEADGERVKLPHQEAIETLTAQSKQDAAAERDAIKRIDEEAERKKKLHFDKIIKIAADADEAEQEHRRAIKNAEIDQETKRKDAIAQIRHLDEDEHKKARLLEETRKDLASKTKELKERETARNVEVLKAQYWKMGFRFSPIRPDTGLLEDEDDIAADRGSFLAADMSGFASRIRNGLAASAPVLPTKHFPTAGKTVPPGYQVTYEDQEEEEEESSSPAPLFTQEEVHCGGKRPRVTSPPPPPPPPEDEFGPEISRLVDFSTPGRDVVVEETGQVKRSIAKSPEPAPQRKRAKRAKKPRGPRIAPSMWPEDPNADEYRTGLEGPYHMPYEDGMIGRPVVCKWCGDALLDLDKICACLVAMPTASSPTT